ncbi:winged helix-turn-helix domain-containing protein [Actinokineospora globicatena]|uniref:winged helix-turn-helix domain-containing protein n=1 Tax=Actinokineospora globicatena TaxID=103729 RepID=UPI0020A36DFB|nr:winged helix-turn-helix domain-containing protein [Actinokineospora globicatena]MCP2300441.1 Helix-turn-helix domain-containing protein [Actinokineospora globicatena]GLW80974.1 transcriptional regulator [Actinokineospora globicatena]GLW88167.1 transcriptional regulator [Actinokineospora globicatena]
MITARLDADVLARIRLSSSPAAEALAWLVATLAERRHPIFGAPGPAARFALRDRDVRMIASTLPTGKGYMPDLLTPPPPRGAADLVLAEQLDMVAATPADVAAFQVAATKHPSADARRAIENGTFAVRAAQGLARFWSAAMTESWSGLRDRLDADITAKSKVMATEGVGALLGSLHTHIRWTGGAIELTKNRSWHWETTPTDLVLSPVALTWPTYYVQLEDPENAVLYYPPQGLGVPTGADRTAVSRLIGPTRATLLRDLHVPRSTTDLSKRHQLAVGTVSYHLSVLHESGLVTKTRAKRTVLYQRTDQAERLQ